MRVFLASGLIGLVLTGQPACAQPTALPIPESDPLAIDMDSDPLLALERQDGGLAAFKQRLQELGIDLDSEAEINAAFAKFKELADRKSEIFDEDIIALVGDESVTSEQEHYRLIALAQRSEMGERPHASVVFAAGASEHRSEAEGNGPVDASVKAIEAVVKSGAEILLYSVNAITSGSTESQGEVTVRLQHGGRVVNGVGADPDIVVASAKAYLSALNKLHSKAERVAAQG